jgi:signal transduction histidine kinase/ActR/RegA family two-component response regulator
VTLGVVFVSETAIMIALERCPFASTHAVLVDPIVLALMTAPLLSLTVLRPMRRALDRQRASERRALDARDAAEKATAAKSRFLAHMSHEIRTPLNGVTGMTSLLRETSLDAEQSECAEAIATCGDQLRTLVNDILDLSKIEAGKLELESVPFNVREVMDDAIRIVTAAVQDRAVVVERSVRGDVPDFVLGDPLRLRQVFINLAMNAANYAQGGAITMTIADAGQPADGDLLRCSVSDTGQGIAENTLALLFRDFSQTSASDSRRHGGTGLGLAISKQLVEMMGGTIGVNSTVGMGSEFWFTARLPKAAASGACVTTLRQATTLAPLGAIRGRRILVADDNAINRRYAVLLLERKLGCLVTTVTNGVEALRELGNNDYDLALLDCEMPELCGPEVTRMVRNRTASVRDHDLPIVAVSAAATKGEVDLCLSAGMDAFVAKPIDVEVLVDVIEKCLANRDGLVPAPKTPSAAPVALTVSRA